MKQFSHTATALVSNVRFLDPGAPRDDVTDPWTSDRHRAILAALTDPPLPGVMPLESSAAGRDALLLVHTSSYIDAVEAYSAGCRSREHDGYRMMSPNVAVASNTFELASLAAGAACTAAELVLRGEVRNALVHARPGDHHAGPALGEAFCVFNSGAIAARYAQAGLGVSRVLIVDWDVHHCNGTQAIFTADPTVVTLSLHGASGLYPRTGDANERGTGAGRGYTINCPLEARSGDGPALRALHKGLGRVPFDPDLVILIAGFDGHRDDPVGNLWIADEGFQAMTEAVLEYADGACRGRVVSILAGGYDREVICRTHLEQLAARAA